MTENEKLLTTNNAIIRINLIIMNEIASNQINKNAISNPIRDCRNNDNRQTICNSYGKPN